MFWWGQYNAEGRVWLAFWSCKHLWSRGCVSLNPYSSNPSAQDSIMATRPTGEVLQRAQDILLSSPLQDPSKGFIFTIYHLSFLPPFLMNRDFLAFSWSEFHFRDKNWIPRSPFHLNLISCYSTFVNVKRNWLIFCLCRFI